MKFCWKNKHTLNIGLTGLLNIEGNHERPDCYQMLVLSDCGWLRFNCLLADCYHK